VQRTLQCSESSPWFRGLLWCVGYLGIALFASWPLCLSPTSTISIGFESEATVPLLNVWTLWWNSDRLGAWLSGYWDAPIFYPTRGTFAFSEAQPTMMVVAPIVWLTGSRVLAYNLYLLAVLTLNGTSSRSLLRRVGYGPWLAFSGGVLCQMLPFVWWQSGVVQLTTLFGMVWTIHALINVFDPDCKWGEATARNSPRESDTESSPTDSKRAAMGRTFSLRRSVLLGGAFCVTYLLCNYWGLFLVLVLVPSSVWFWNWSMVSRRFWLEIVVAAAIPLLVLGSIVVEQRSLAAEHQWTRDPTLIRDLSAHPRDYMDTPSTFPRRSPVPNPVDDSGNPGAVEMVAPVSWSLFPQLDSPEEGRGDLWPLGGGPLKLFLAPVGLIAALLSRRRRWGLFAATFTAIAFGLSLGPSIRFASWVPWLASASPYELLQQSVPGFSLIRSPFRFALFVQWGVAWLSLEALELLNPGSWRFLSRSPDNRNPPCGTSAVQAAGRRNSSCWHWKDLLLQGLLGVATVILVIEVWPPRQGDYQPPATTTVPAWILWLRENSVPADAVVCLPFPTGYTVHDYQETAVWMYWGTLHQRPLVNGYSGFFPANFVTLKEELTGFYHHDGDASLPMLRFYPWDSPGLKRLNECGARFVVVRRSFASRDDVWQHSITKFRWSWVTADEQQQLDIYEILPVEPE
jgi:hypothetical protein